MNDFHAAESKYSNLLSIDPHDGDSYYERADLRLKENRYNEAVDDYLMAIKYKSYRSIHAYIQIARIKSEQKDHQSAVDFYSSALAIEDFPEIYYERGIDKFYLNDIKGAIEDYDMSLKLCLETDLMAKIHNELGYALYSIMEYKTAQENFSRAISLNESLASAYFNRGMTKIKRGDISACEDFRVGCELGNSKSCSIYSETCP